MRSLKCRFAFAVLLALTASGSAFPAEDKHPPDNLVQFAGEVAQGHEFRRPIGHGLVFALVPDLGNPGAQSGWTIAVSPEGKQEHAECKEYSWVVMPPYHSYNGRYLSNTYGITARQTVEEMSPRDFSFVLNCEDYAIEYLRFEFAVGSSSHSQKERDDALAKLGTSPQGRGKLWIDKSRISKAAREIEGVNYGSIDWIQFHVEIRFP